MPLSLHHTTPTWHTMVGLRYDFIIRQEHMDDDVKLLWDYLGVPKDVTPPSVTEFNSMEHNHPFPEVKGLDRKESEKKMKEDLKRLIREVPDIRQSFCSTYAADFICFGYDKDFEELCGDLEPETLEFPREEALRLLE